MFSSIQSVSLQGIHGIIVNVEVDARMGLPGFSMVGYVSAQVKESGERVSAAIANSGFKLEPKKIIVNLSPADVKKEGTSFDLPIALGILAELYPAKEEYLNETVFAGELGLDGSVRKIRGILPMAEAAIAAGKMRFVVPYDNAWEASYAKGIEIIPVKNLAEAVAELGKDCGQKREQFKKKTVTVANMENRGFPDFSDIHGQENVKRALTVAAAGMHNVLMIGPAGCGKTMLAKSLTGIMPPLEESEQEESVKIYSVAGLFDESPAKEGIRPFRNPPCTVSRKALTGDSSGLPGEISLAHRGVLFLDELPEFERKTIDGLRAPLEDGFVRMTGYSGDEAYPANVLLVAAMNPCRCGFYPDRKLCHCNENDVKRYLEKISRPMIDRFDIFTETKRAGLKDLLAKAEKKSSSDVRKRVNSARWLQEERYKGMGIHFNSELKGSAADEICRLTEGAKTLLTASYDRLKLSLRAYYRMICVARTIADLAGKKDISEVEMAEAIHYRELAVRFWG